MKTNEEEATPFFLNVRYIDIDTNQGNDDYYTSLFNPFPYFFLFSIPSMIPNAA